MKPSNNQNIDHEQGRDIQRRQPDKRFFKKQVIIISGYVSGFIYIFIHETCIFYELPTQVFSTTGIKEKTGKIGSGMLGNTEGHSANNLQLIRTKKSKKMVVPNLLQFKSVRKKHRV